MMFLKSQNFEPNLAVSLKRMQNISNYKRVSKKRAITLYAGYQMPMRKKRYLY